MAHRGRQNADEALIAALASGRKVVDVARAAGVAERTVYRRLSDPTFAAKVADARARMVSQALGRLANDMTAAATTLRRLLKAKAEPVRLGAARSILELGNRLRETVELEARLAALEARDAR